MKYKQIVQELRESKDLNVQIFLKTLTKGEEKSSHQITESRCYRHPCQELHSHDHQDRLCEQFADEFNVVSRSGGRGRYRSL